jgi:hypothetical protein
VNVYEHYAGKMNKIAEVFAWSYRPEQVLKLLTSYTSGHSDNWHKGTGNGPRHPLR